MASAIVTGHVSPSDHQVCAQSLWVDVNYIGLCSWCLLCSLQLEGGGEFMQCNLTPGYRGERSSMGCQHCGAYCCWPIQLLGLDVQMSDRM